MKYVVQIHHIWFLLCGTPQVYNLGHSVAVNVQNFVVDLHKMHISGVKVFKKQDKIIIIIIISVPMVYLLSLSRRMYGQCDGLSMCYMCILVDQLDAQILIVCLYLSLSALHVSKSLVHHQERRSGAVYRNWYKPVSRVIAWLQEELNFSSSYNQVQFFL